MCTKIALYINDSHIIYYHMDGFRSVILGHSYFTSPDYLVVQGWIRAMLLYSTNIVLEGPNFYQYFKFFAGVVSTFTQVITLYLFWM